MITKQYNSTKLHKELIAAGLEIEGVTSEGRIDWKADPTPEMISQANQVMANHLVLGEEEARRQMLLDRSITPEMLVDALWQKIIDGNPEPADKLQQLIQGVFPSPILRSV